MAKTAWTIAFLLVLFAAPRADAEETWQREVKEAKEKIAALLREAEELDRAGRKEDAAHLKRKAEDLRAELHAFVKRHEGKGDEAGKGDVVEGLERGIVALRKLGREEEARRLEEIAREVRGRGGDKEGLGHRIEVMRLGVQELAGAGKRDAADLLERAVHALRVEAAGRRDEEAARIRERAPGPGETAELLGLAAGIAAERGWEDRAEMLARLGREYAKRAGRDERGPDRELAMVQGWIRIARVGMEALLAAGQRDAAHRLEQGIHAMELEREDRRDDEAMRIRKGAPGRPEMGKLLMAAADHLAQQGRRDLAEKVDALGREWAGRHGQEPVRGDGAMERIERLEDRMKGLEQGIERLAGALRELNDSLRKDREAREAR